MLQIIGGRALSALGRPLVQQSGALMALAGPLPFHASSSSGRCASSAAKASAAAAAVDSSSSSTTSRWDPCSAVLPRAQYEVSLIIKGFELRFVKQASTVIRDLLLLCFAPKSMNELPVDLSRGRNQLAALRDSPVALAVPLGDHALPTRRTIFTVIRGPHIHKTSREQFQRLVHRRVIKHPTTSHTELQWFLDALRSYDFVGVEVRVRVGSRSFLTPTPPEDDAGDAAASRPFLADHFAKFPHLFPAAVLGGGASAPGIGASFDAVEAAARRELLGERLRLQGTEAYSQWLRGLNRDAVLASAEAAAAAADGAGGLAAIGRAVAAEYAAAAAAGGAAAAQPLESALADAARRVLLDPGLVPELTG
jgi:ribosomal protein S10